MTPVIVSVVSVISIIAFLAGYRIGYSHGRHDGKVKIITELTDKLEELSD
jgi:hypothetical protein